MRLSTAFLALGQLVVLAQAARVDPKVLDACPGYKAQNVHSLGPKLTADLVLAGKACDVFGKDIQKLKLEVTYETKSRIHLKITDAQNKRYEIPESVLPRPKGNPFVAPFAADIRFDYVASPFSFKITRTATKEVLFDTSAHPLIFEPQFLRVKTALPANPNIYGLGEHTDPLRLPTHDYTRTIWSHDSPGVPTGTELYGNHPIYFDHRLTGTHGVFLMNSNGIDVKINDTDGAATLEYNVIGGVLDFYFLAGSTRDPTEVARQYADIVGAPAEVPYWSFGLHQCRWGYHNYVEVADVISGYAEAKIPLEVMWTDIDYMDRRRIFTTQPDYFPLNRMRDIVDYLHSHDQKFILMTDPAVAYVPGENYGAFDRGTDADIWMRNPNNTGPYLGVVWPGVTVYPDWFNPKTQDYWNNEFKLFYNPETGLDIDGCWIDMNEPANFCTYPCPDPYADAVGLPPPPTGPAPDPNAPIFGQTRSKRADLALAGIDHSGDNIDKPPYALSIHTLALSDKTAHTNALHWNGLVEYDTHNLYGSMMSIATRNALLKRRPGLRTFVITRSTFAGAGASVGKWLGDNVSNWENYRQSIQGILSMAGIYHIPMVGADICGFIDHTTEQLCARWAMLGAFYPFMRNHNIDGAIPQEFFRWESVAQAARNAIDARYRLLDYIYTAFHQASIDGTPVLNPLFFKYPQDPKTFAIEGQYLFGPSILVSPVLEQDSTTVEAYFPDDVFYDFFTFAPVRLPGGGVVSITGVNTTTIPVHIRGGAVLPLRIKSALTTAALRENDFELVVAPGLDGTASGSLYLDDGVSLVQKTKTEATFTFRNRKLSVQGHFGFATKAKFARVRFLGVKTAPKTVTVNLKKVAPDAIQHHADTQYLDVTVAIPLQRGFTVELH